MSQTENNSTPAREILIVEDSPPQAFILKKLLLNHGYSPRVAVHGAEALEMVRAHAPDLVLSDINMPVMNGYEMCHALKRDPATAHVPVILLTTLSDSNSLLEGLKCQADYYLTKPYDSKYLLDRVQNLLDGGGTHSSVETPQGLEITFGGTRHLVTANRREMLNLLLSTYENAVQQNLELIRAQQKLNNLNHELQEQSRKLRVSEKNFRALLENSVDATVVLDAKATVRFANPAAERLLGAGMAELLGTTLPFETNAGDVREITLESAPKRPVHLDLRVVATDWEGQVASLVTLRDITQRKLDEAKIQEQQKRLQEANTLLEALATLDGLTGLKNRRVLNERLEEEFHRAVRYNLPLSIVLLDVDHFKQYNDAHGHPAGDEVLKAVAEILKRNTRDTDFVARYGGEEFVILLPLTHRADVIFLAERLRFAITSRNWALRPVTASFGAATYQSGVDRAEHLLEQADAALYHSKRLGRNRVTHFQALEKG